MAKIQTTVKISYNGPFTNYQTGSLSFSQTTRNIAIPQSLMKIERPTMLKETLTQKTTE